MKTSVRSSLRPALALATAFIVTGTAASAQVLQSFQFGDAPSTTLTGVANSGPGSATFGANLGGIATNGAGALVVAYNSTASGRSFADIPDLTTGIVQLDVNIASWDFTGAPAVGPLFEIGFSAATTGNNAAIRTAHIYFEVSDTEVLLAGVAGGTGAVSTPAVQDQFFSLERLTPLTIRLTANFNTRAYSISTSDTGYSVLSAGTIATGRGGNFLSIRALDDFTIGGTGGNLTIDSVTLTAIPEPSTYAALAGLAILGVAIIRRRR